MTSEKLMFLIFFEKKHDFLRIRKMLKPLSLLSFLALMGYSQEPDFTKEIKPILLKNCIGCHGGVKAAGEISFVYQKSILGEGESGKICVVPFKPEESELIKRVTHHDPEEIMPKPEHGKPLSDKDITLLKNWIKAGAKWQDHWSFIPPSEPENPSVKNDKWARSKADTIALSEMEKHNFSPSPEAGKAEWLRRASLDLIGLPPTQEEWQAFQNDSSPEAYEHAVDRLLASPHYGERWAAMWLDLARYSDTFGYQKDPNRTIWQWRDWVIKAFNENMPYDVFTKKQLAGDLLENSSADDIIATAFHRNSLNNVEGGTSDEEFRETAVMDRIRTTWTAWLGTTFQCVQCHAHPYDPYTHDDYYHFMAFFNNAEDVDLNDDYPTIKIANDPTQREQTIQLKKQIDTKRNQINEGALRVAEQMKDFNTPKANSMDVTPNTGKLAQKENGTFVSSGTVPVNSAYILKYPAQNFSAIKLEILPVSDDPTKWTDLAAVCSQFSVSIITADGQKQDVKFSQVIADAMVGPYDPNTMLEKGDTGFGDFPAQLGPRYCYVIPESNVMPPPNSIMQVSINHSERCNESQACILKRFRVSFSNDTQAMNYVSTDAFKNSMREIKVMRDQHKAIPSTPLPVIMERKMPRLTRMHLRGSRMTLADVKESLIPEIFLKEKPKSAMNRLQLSDWLTSKDNPLTARVLVNRLWAELYGAGIVESQEDFGSSGLPPSNQALLDHLALRLRDHYHWQFKPFLREIVLSSTYRQTNLTTPEMAKKDPKNLLYTHGPRQRLSAEMIRDQSLQISGLLSRKQFGAPVFPPQPPLNLQHAQNRFVWTTSEGEDRYRRAIYTFHKRSNPYPTYTNFDAPARDICSARRINTNTPLQALNTLNDPAMLEFAQAFAKNMAAKSNNLTEQIQFAHEQLTFSPASTKTVTALSKLYQDVLENPDYLILATTKEQAALVLVANTMLNMDSVLTK